MLRNDDSTSGADMCGDVDAPSTTNTGGDCVSGFTAAVSVGSGSSNAPPPLSAVPTLASPASPTEMLRASLYLRQSRRDEMSQSGRSFYSPVTTSAGGASSSGVFPSGYRAGPAKDIQLPRAAAPLVPSLLSPTTVLAPPMGGEATVAARVGCPPGVRQRSNRSTPTEARGRSPRASDVLPVVSGRPPDTVLSLHSPLLATRRTEDKNLSQDAVGGGGEGGFDRPLRPPAVGGAATPPPSSRDFWLMMLGTFCLLNGTLALLFAWMLAGRHVSFAVVVAERGWEDPDAKARCLRRAAAYYLLIAGGAFAGPLYRDCRRPSPLLAVAPSSPVLADPGRRLCGCLCQACVVIMQLAWVLLGRLCWPCRRVVAHSPLLQRAVAAVRRRVPTTWFMNTRGPRDPEEEMDHISRHL